MILGSDKFPETKAIEILMIYYIENILILITPTIVNQYNKESSNLLNYGIFILIY